MILFNALVRQHHMVLRHLSSFLQKRNPVGKIYGPAGIFFFILLFQLQKRWIWQEQAVSKQIRQQLIQQVLTSKLYDAIEKAVTLDKKTVSLDEFKTIAQEA